MQEKQFVLPSPGVTVIADAAAEKLFATGSGDAALVYLYILKNSGSVSLGEAAKKLGISPERLKDAVRLLSEAGLVSASGSVSSAPPLSPPDNPPGYTSADIVRNMDHSEGFRQVVNEAQRKLGKILSSADLSVLLGLYDYLGLPADVLCLLITHCIEEAHRRYGNSRMPTMRSIEKKAYEWARLELLTADLAEEHLKKLKNRAEAASRAAQVLHISGRPLSTSEERFLGEWIEMGFGPEELELAYDRTVLKTGKLSWGYMNSILKSWHEKGLHTVPAIESGDQKKPARAPSSPSRCAEHDDDLEWMRNYIKEP